VSERETENSGTVPEGDSASTPAEAEEVSANEAEAPAAPAADIPEAAEEPTPTEAEAVETPGGTVPSGDSPGGPAAAKRQRSRRHVPRAERRKRPKVRAKAEGVRKPILRQPKPERERGRTQERRGIVVSNAMDKTIVVKVDVLKVHPRYKKVIRRSQKFHAHDERNQANVGDVVRIVETRPLAKTKNWRLVEVVEAAK
jgi:small subunit ribosomal protein S17